MIYLTRKERFNAAHRLFIKAYSDEENERIFGKCSNPNWHGHNYILYVTIKGEVDRQTGFLVNLKDLRDMIREQIIEKADHKNLNLEVDFMKGKIPTSENIAMAIWEVLEPFITKMGCMMHKVRIEETENNFVEYYGD